VTKGIAVLLAAGAGMLVGMQPPINSKLGHSVGTFAAATISFLVGTIFLLLVALVAGNSNVGALRGLPWWYFVGGFFGAAFVTTSLVTVRTLGAGGVVAATIAGQLTMSVILDRLGLIGLTQRPLSLARILGVILLALGVFLVVRD
jgi:transporter family-2 protein